MNSLNLINGNIITLNSTHPVVNSLSIDKGKILYLNKTSPKFKTLDLKGTTVIPGFIDAHFHLKNYGKRLEQLDFKGVDSLDKIKVIIQNKLKEVEPNEWILGFGWDQNLFADKSFPPSEFLNQIAPNNPLYFTRIDGHSAWINKKALLKTNSSLYQINNLDGGQVINDCILIDNSMSVFKNILPSENKKQVKKWILNAANKACSYGITGVHDAWQDALTIESIKELICI